MLEFGIRERKGGLSLIPSIQFQSTGGMYFEEYISNPFFIKNMSETEHKDIPVDSQGRVALNDVVLLLKELRHEVRASMDQIRSRRVNATKQKLMGANKIPHRPRATHLKLVASNTSKNGSISEESLSIPGVKNTKDSVLIKGEGMVVPRNISSDKSTWSEKQQNLTSPKPLPEIEELHDIISLLDKLEN